MLCYFNYTVNVYDEYDTTERTVSGIVYGKDIVDATSNLAEYYGKDNIIAVLCLEYLSDLPVLECKDSDYDLEPIFLK